MDTNPPTDARDEIAQGVGDLRRATEVRRDDAPVSYYCPRHGWTVRCTLTSCRGA